MDRENVHSSAIKEIGYTDGLVEIQFHNADIYHYFDVPADEYQKLFDAESQGTYLNTIFKSKRFKYKKITK